MSETFAGLGLAPGIVEALTALGYEEPTPIQAAAIPPLLAGRDILAQASTGTGKTAAFALPLLQRLSATRPSPFRPAVLVLVPTRELAMQVAEAFHRYGRPVDALTVPIYGGAAFSQQAHVLRRGVHVVVATPGRALDHLRRGTLDLGGLSAVVLDEADEMLDMGFAEDLEAILGAVPAECQTALFSATLPPRIGTIADAHLKDPLRVLVAREKTAAGTMPKVRQTAYMVSRAQKVQALGRVLDLETPTLALIFCRTRNEVDTLAESLAGRGYRVESLHGGLQQEQRDRVMKRARSGTVDLLVATDVAARGLDIEHVSHVVNFDVPQSAEAYIHRIGRTGRAGREGVAITFAEPREHRMLRTIEQSTKQKIAVAQLPTVLDVQAKRLEITRGSLREAIVAGELDGYRVIVEALAQEFDLMDIATAAAKLVHEAGAGAVSLEDSDQPASEIENDRPFADDTRGSRGKAGKHGKHGTHGTHGTHGKVDLAAMESMGGGRGRSTGMSRIYIGLGRNANVRPADLVGAIANEAQITSRDIGAIEISDKFSLVELPEELIDRVIAALKATTIKGKRQVVRRDKAEEKKPRARR